MLPKRRSMILSTNFSSRSVLILTAVLFCLCGCSAANGPAISKANQAPGAVDQLLIAVLPVQNLSSAPAPLNDIRQLLISEFTTKGINILDPVALEGFLSRHRIRYVGGVDTEKAELFREEAGAGAVLITTLGLYSEVAPPKIALTCRLISTGNPPSILWMEDIGLSGDDASGILDIGLVETPAALNEKALQRISASLSQYLSGQRHTKADAKKRKKFWPKVIHRSPVFEPGMKYRVAVVPFLNLSQRKYAGELVALHFVRQLKEFENFNIVEPGDVWQALLVTRIIMEDGLSLANADVVFSKLNADLILTGRVMDYLDYQGPSGNPKVDFSVQLIERKSREVVWSSKSYNQGDDGVFFFDLGKVNTAHSMTSEMVYHVVDMIVE